MVVRGFLYATIVVFTWSGWYIVSKLGLSSTLTQWDLILLRFATASILVLPLLLKNKSRLKSIFTGRMIFCSLCYGTIYLVLAFSGLSISPASNSGVLINGTLPIFSTLISVIWFSRSITKMNMLGIIIVIIANIILFQDAEFFNLGVLMLLMGSIFYSFYLVAIKRWEVDIHTIMVAVPWVNFLVFLPIWLFLPSQMTVAPMQEILGQMFYQGFLVNFMALYLMSQAVLYIGSIKATMILALIPSFTGVLAYLILKEEFTIYKLITLITCTIGIFIFNIQTKNTR